jgi:hypothetical protein
MLPEPSETFKFQPSLPATRSKIQTVSRSPEGGEVTDGEVGDSIYEVYLTFVLTPTITCSIDELPALRGYQSPGLNRNCHIHLACI